MPTVADQPTAPSQAPERHPRGLYILFATELWERFGFYTAAAIMTLYLQYGGFGWTKSDAGSLWSNYMMFVYLTPLAGGWLADRILGYRRSVLIGGAFFIAGYVALGMGRVEGFYLGLASLFVGNGFFKPNISTMVGNLYRPGSPLRDAAYNIFYMGINIGAFLGPIVAEAVRQAFVPQALYTAAKNHEALSAADALLLKNGYLTAFLCAAGGMTLGTIAFCFFYRSLAGAEQKRSSSSDTEALAVTEDLPPAHDAPAIDAVPERQRVGALLIIFSIVVVFWMIFHQNGTSMTWWADENTDWKSSRVIPWFITLLSLGTVDPAEASGVISNSINAFWIIVLSIPLVKFWGWLNKRGIEPSTPTKMAIGMVLAGLSFLILAVAARLGGDQDFQFDSQGQALLTEKGEFRAIQHLVSPWWLIASYGVLSLGELCLSPMGLSLVSKVAPARMRGLMMGGWFVATAIGNKLTVISVLWPRTYHSTFWLLDASLAMMMAVILLTLLRRLKRAMPGV
jgi:POT family proton-dependent oligopeptide transporter